MSRHGTKQLKSAILDANERCRGNKCVLLQYSIVIDVGCSLSVQAVLVLDILGPFQRC